LKPKLPHLYPKKLDIYIAKKFITLFVGAFFICIFILMMQFLWKYVDELIGKGLSLEVLGQFFWYMALMMVPQALPLAILLSSLITFGNLGENCELTAIKAAGISLLQSFRSLIFICVLITLASLYFSDTVGPRANLKITQLLLSMKQTSPELEIPEGIFYDGIPNSNIYVQKKDLQTGKLYSIMIYRMTGSYEDQAIILADSGMLQSTAEKKHLLLTLWNGEWFENMRSQELAGSASVPYRRETFVHKKILMDYDADFNMTDIGMLSNNAKGKSINQLSNDIDSLNEHYDSIGRSFLQDYNRSITRTVKLSANDMKRANQIASKDKNSLDSVYAHLKPESKQQAINQALSRTQSELQELSFRSMITSDGDKLIRLHKIELINKFTQALTCLIFFFIGAPLGAIIRKGGLGVPVIVSVLVFILYYMLDNTGYRMARGGMWTIAFGKGLAPAVLIPMAVFTTYKAVNDSMVFNFELWADFFRRMLGLRQKRSITGKEVIIIDPDYARDAQRLKQLTRDIKEYSYRHHLRHAPNPIKVFFKYQPDHRIEKLNEELETVIDDLSNTRDKVILTGLNHYPVLAVKAHTRPFEHRWMNIVAAIIVPLGLFFWLRMWSFRLRLLRDLHTIRRTNEHIIEHIDEMNADKQEQDTQT